MWNLNNSISFLKKLEEKISLVGFHCGLTGSVLVKGKSLKDLDIIIYPHDSSNYNLDELQKVFTELGLRKYLSQSYVTRKWNAAGSNDTKNVDIWKTKEGKRIDFFYLK